MIQIAMDFFGCTLVSVEFPPFLEIYMQNAPVFTPEKNVSKCFKLAANVQKSLAKQAYSLNSVIN